MGVGLRRFASILILLLATTAGAPLALGQSGIGQALSTSGYRVASGTGWRNRIDDAAANAEDILQNCGDRFRDWYVANRTTVVKATSFFHAVGRSQPYSLALLFLFVSTLLWGRERQAQLRNLFVKLMSKAPIPLYRNGGVTDEHIRIVRELLFFTCVYILYELAARFLAFQDTSNVSFYSNFVFRLILILLLLRAHWRLRINVLGRKTLSDEQKMHLQEWFDEHFAHLDVSATTVRRLAIGIFLFTFGPTAIYHLPQVLDRLTAK